jgi:hypothetical protein
VCCPVVGRTLSHRQLSCWDLWDVSWAECAVYWWPLDLLWTDLRPVLVCRSNVGCVAGIPGTFYGYFRLCFGGSTLCFSNCFGGLLRCQMRCFDFGMSKTSASNCWMGSSFNPWDALWICLADFWWLIVDGGASQREVFQYKF